MLEKTNTGLKPKDLALAHLFLRLLLGVNFFNHGFTRIGNIPGFVEETVKTLEGSYFPEPLVRINAFLVPIIELVVGILITLGLATRISLSVTFGLMIMLMMGVTISTKLASRRKSTCLRYCAVYVAGNLSI